MPDSIIRLPDRPGEGDLDEFLRLVYGELHRIAEGYLRREAPCHTLQPTALIHEAYLRLRDSVGLVYKDRAHFYAVAARVMRHILVDHARTRRALKRDGGVKFSLDEIRDFPVDGDHTVIALNDALDELAKQDEAKARLIEMRFFGGLTAGDISECTGVPVHTVRRQLRSAQAWLRREVAP